MKIITIYLVPSLIKPIKILNFNSNMNLDNIQLEE